eukprot:2412914-Lingulodinium_polyedra.AAC.1
MEYSLLLRRGATFCSGCGARRSQGHCAWLCRHCWTILCADCGGGLPQSCSGPCPSPPLRPRWRRGSL